ncbi:MAG: hypothetical protein NTX56_04940 [Proteobacteria bacterium]|jgi:hypothetical protein|nr:hypothetical protein [Pseudomonadota bacterium]
MSHGFKVKARGTIRGTREINRVEIAYRDHLDQLKMIGHVMWRSEHEALKLRLADNTHYIADFLVMLPNGVLEVHDTKGTTKRPVTKDGVEIGKTETYFCPPKNKQKLKMVAELFPIVVKIVWRNKAGQWIEEAV